MPGAAIVHCTPCGKLARSTERVRTGNGNRCYLAMAHDDVREPNPQEAQRDGQSAISQGSPLKELHQEGDANSDRPVGSPLATPELTDEEVSVLCDIERDGSAKPDKQAIGSSRARLYRFLRRAARTSQAYAPRAATVKQARRWTE